jgi:L-aminopeptidase/D-esterase-like protein
MAQDGLARTISPVHTSIDGDTVFAASVGGPPEGNAAGEPFDGPVGVAAAPDVVGAWGARVLGEAVLRAVRAARGTPDFPSVSELRPE